MRRTVQDLKDFSRTDDEVFAWANLHTELEKVINIAHYHLKQNVTLVRHFGALQEVLCSPGQVNYPPLKWSGFLRSSCLAQLSRCLF